MEQSASLLFLHLHYCQCSPEDPERTVGHRGHQPPAEPEMDLEEKVRGILQQPPAETKDRCKDRCTIAAPAANIQCVHHNLSQSSAGHVL